MNRFVLWPESRERITANLVRFVGQLPAGKAWEVTVKPYAKDRSQAQNRALFGLAYPILAESTGHTVPELHEYFCGDYFGWVEVEIFGETHKRPIRTTTTDEQGKREVIKAKDFAGFFAHVQRRAAESGVYIPDPQVAAPVRAGDHQDKAAGG